MEETLEQTGRFDLPRTYRRARPAGAEDRGLPEAAQPRPDRFQPRRPRVPDRQARTWGRRRYHLAGLHHTSRAGWDQVGRRGSHRPLSRLAVNWPDASGRRTPRTLPLSACTDGDSQKVLSFFIPFQWKRLMVAIEMEFVCMCAGL